MVFLYLPASQFLAEFPVLLLIGRRVIPAFQETEIRIPHPALHGFLGHESVQKILPEYLLINEIVAKVRNNAILFRMGSRHYLVHKNSRKICATFEISITWAAASQIHFVEINLVSHDIEFHIEHARIMEILQHGDDFFATVPHELKGVHHP